MSCPMCSQCTTRHGEAAVRETLPRLCGVSPHKVDGERQLRDSLLTHHLHNSHVSNSGTVGLSP
eukprot:4200962-Pleurochrysis_carterae.AAC.1